MSVGYCMLGAGNMSIEYCTFWIQLNSILSVIFFDCENVQDAHTPLFSLQIGSQHQAIDWHSISPEKVQWIVMPVQVVVYLMGDLILALPHQAQVQALAQMMCQLMM